MTLTTGPPNADTSASRLSSWRERRRSIEGPEVLGTGCERASRLGSEYLPFILLT